MLRSLGVGQRLLAILLQQVIEAHLLNNRKVRLVFAPHHAVVVVPAFVKLPKVQVLNGHMIISDHFGLQPDGGLAKHPSQLKKLFKAKQSLSIISQLLIAFAHPQIGEHFKLFFYVL